MSKLVLFVNHRQRRCGIHEFGLEVVAQLESSDKFCFEQIECESIAEFLVAVEELSPRAILFNYHPGTMPWAPSAAVACADIPSIGIIHDVTAEMADCWTSPLFDRLIALDPSLRTANPIFFSTPRPLPMYRPLAEPLENGPPRIGSFGFASLDKGFDELVRVAQKEFDECLIRLHMPDGDFADPNAAGAREICEQCQSLIYKPGVSLEVSHDFLSRDQLIDFLASNDINALFYDPDRGLGGISGAADLAIVSGRPLALRRGKMFRHFAAADPSIFIDDLSLKEILSNGTAPLQPFLRSWTQQASIAAYEAVIESALSEVNGSSLRRRRIAACMTDALLTDGKKRESSLQTRLDAMHDATIFLRAEVEDRDVRIGGLNCHIGNLSSRVASLTSHIETMAMDVTQLSDKVQRLETDAHRLAAELDALQRSTSWRLTAPVRAAARLLGRQ